jgi:P4 family phage/plasmid primase-like protien
MKAYSYKSIIEWADSQRNTRTGIELSRSGIPVFPCKQDKTPDTAHGFKDATTDQTRIVYFFRKPDLLIGMPTGLRSNIDVIDEDPKNGGNLNTLGSLPMDVMARTRSGGRHVFFKHRDGVRNTTGLRPGIDVRGEGGYVILWPYSDDGEWLGGDLFRDLPEYPANLSSGGVKLKPGGIDTEAMRTGVNSGARNDSIFRGLCKFRHLNKPIEEAKEWASNVAMNSSPPYTEVNTDDMAERVYAEYEPGDFPEPDLHTRTLAGKNFHHTDMGNADRFDHLHGDSYLYVHAWNCFMVWTGKRWERDERGEMGRLAENTVRAIYREAADTEDSAERRLLAKHAKSSEAHHRLQAMLERLKSRHTATPEDFDRDPMLLNCANGTLDLNTGTLREHNRADRITKIAPVAYDPNADAPTFDKFLRDILPSESVRRFVQRLTGYALNGKTNEKALPILHGTGDNGKSTLLNVLMEMCGEYSLQASNDLLMGRSSHPTEVADLHGRRFVTNVETEEGRRLKESLVKQLTGGDRISARRMREDPWNFWPTHTLFMATNHKPEIRGTDNAIWTRIKLIPFDVSIPKDQQDRELPEKLRKELPGILAWAVRGHTGWLREGLQEPEEVKAATDSYRSDMDVLARFIDEECETGEGLKVKTSLLYGRYKLWCEESGEPVMRSQDFSGSLQDRGFSRGKSDGTRVYKSIVLARSQPSTTTSGAHGADENHKLQENLPRVNKQNHVTPSDPDVESGENLDVQYCGECNSNTLFVFHDVTKNCGKCSYEYEYGGYERSQRERPQ